MWSALGLALSEDIDYKSQKTPTKVFIIERVASALFATQPHWRVRMPWPQAQVRWASPRSQQHRQ